MTTDMKEIERVAKLLMKTWATTEWQPVRIEYLATFEVLARALIEDQVAPVRLAEDFGEARPAEGQAFNGTPCTRRYATSPIRPTTAAARTLVTNLSIFAPRAWIAN